MQTARGESLKLNVVHLRRRGYSYPMIEKELGVSRATISGWLRGIALPKAAEKIILTRRKRNLKELRRKAYRVLRLRQGEQGRLLRKSIRKDFFGLNFDSRIRELLLATLYLGEGFKRRSCLGLGNSNPEIMKLFVVLVRTIYKIDEEKFRCYLHLRMDQIDEQEKLFWSKQLKISLSQFRKTQFDKRTANTETWRNYHGVCIVYYYDASLEKRLSEIQKVVFDKI